MVRPDLGLGAMLFDPAPGVVCLITCNPNDLFCLDFLFGAPVHTNPQFWRGDLADRRTKHFLLVIVI